MTMVLRNPLFWIIWIMVLNMEICKYWENSLNFQSIRCLRNHMYIIFLRNRQKKWMAWNLWQVNFFWGIIAASSCKRRFAINFCDTYRSRFSSQTTFPYSWTIIIYIYISFLNRCFPIGQPLSNHPFAKAAQWTPQAKTQGLWDGIPHDEVPLALEGCNEFEDLL